MNKIAILTAAAVAAVSFGVGGAFAQNAGGDFAKADANKDGFVTQEEAMGVYSTLTPDLFTKADANGDGKLDETEFAALQGLTAGVDANQATSASSSAASGADTGTSASSSQSSSTSP